MDHLHIKALVLLLLLLGGCDWLWPLEGEFDPHRCDPQCSSGISCHDGVCGINLDGGPSPDKALPGVDRAVGDVVLSTEPLPGKELGPGCVQGAMVCLDDQKIKVCDNGLWKNSSCGAQCVAAKYDYSVICKEQGGKASCQCANWMEYGGLCTKTELCAPGLLCTAFTPGAAVGVCSKHCQADTGCTGGPPLSYGICVLLDSSTGKKICAFKCGKHVCPTGLKCSVTDLICRPPLTPAP